MDVIVDAIARAIGLLVHADPEVVRIALLSLVVSGTATLLSVAVGVPLGAFLGLGRLRGRQAVIGLVNTGMAFPPVVVGLVVMVMLWRSGPLGSLHMLYTPWAMILAQFLLSLPIVAGISLAAMQQLDPKLRLQVTALGASRLQLFWVLARETRLPLMAAVMAGFGAVISEVGASMMVGGNVVGETRVLTTAIVMETGRGNFATAVALSVILMALVYVVNVYLTFLQQRSRPR